MAKDANTVAAEWSARLAQSGQKMADGVNAVQVAPGQAAAKQKEVWAANVAAAKDKWAARTASVSLPEWQQAMITKGVPRIASGATAAEPKFAAFMGELLPFIDNVKRSLPARGGLEQNISRAAQFARGMAKFQRR